MEDAIDELYGVKDALAEVDDEKSKTKDNALKQLAKRLNGILADNGCIRSVSLAGSKVTLE